MRRNQCIITFSIFAGFVLVAQNAAAQSGECTTDDHCAAGMTCNTEYSTCQFAECTVDEDCESEFLVCTHENIQTCTVSGEPTACAEGEECELPELIEEECEVTPISMCLPQYFRLCEEAADCGPNFNCVEVGCMCPDGSAGDGLEEEECYCEDSDEKHCEIIDISCTDGSQCPDGWECEADGGGTTPDEQGNVTPNDLADDPETDKFCLPPYFKEAINFTGVSPEMSATAGGNSETGPIADDSRDFETTDSVPEGAASDSSTKKRDGCQFTPGLSVSSDVWSLLLIGAALALARRRWS